MYFSKFNISTELAPTGLSIDLLDSQNTELQNGCIVS
jgi:hypothetical protein